MECIVIDEMHPCFVPLLTEAGIKVNYLPNIAPAEVSEKLTSADVLVVRSKLRIDTSLLKNSPKLKLVARAGAGIDNVDEAALRQFGISLVNAPEGNQKAVGEHTVGMLLCLLRHLHSADQEVRNKEWQREANRGMELGSLTVGIIGYGNMGRSFAKHLSGFGCKVLAYDKYLDHFPDQNAQACSIADIQNEADVLSLHIPLTPETKGMVNASFLNSFKSPIYFVNTSRGDIVKQRDLVAALKSGKVVGTALDVLENEQLEKLSLSQSEDFTYLAAAKNVLLTPHIAGWTHQSHRKIAEVLADKIRLFLKAST
jgi:D-3-phosphoglycerate dehydrogenase